MVLGLLYIPSDYVLNKRVFSVGKSLSINCPFVQHRAWGEILIEYEDFSPWERI